MTLDLARLHELRGWTPVAMTRLGVTIDGDRIVIPVLDATGDLIGRLRYQPDPAQLNGLRKMLADAGTTRELFPPPESIADDEHDGTVWLVEGEPDALRAWSIGLTAVGVPGAQTWQNDWATRFSGRRWTVVVCFDCDAPGREIAERAATALAANGVDVRVVDLDPERDDDFDLTDFLAAATDADARAQAARLLCTITQAAPPFKPRPHTDYGVASDEQGGLRTVLLDEFIAVDEQGAGAILGERDAPVIPEGGIVVAYGDGGVGKTTLFTDFGFHLAAGDNWLGIVVVDPRRVLLVENESPRPHFRKKLARKREAWGGSALDDRLRVYEHPWGRFSFANAKARQMLADEIAQHEIDVVIVGPLTSVGMDQPGTLAETRGFDELVREVGELSGRAVAFVLIHHENARGKVSGAWSGVGDALLHVTQQGHGRLRLFFEKARWSSAWHQTALALVWADGDGFAIEDKAELDDEALADLLVAAIANDPGTGWSKVEKATPGVGVERRRQVRDRLLLDDVIVNVAKNDSGETVVMRECRERKSAHLYLASDPTIRHLRRESDADATQTATPWGESGSAHLRPASRSKETQEAETQIFTPPDLDDEEIERLADLARAQQEDDS